MEVIYACAASHALPGNFTADKSLQSFQIANSNINRGEQDGVDVA